MLGSFKGVSFTGYVPTVHILNDSIKIQYSIKIQKDCQTVLYLQQGVFFNVFKEGLTWTNESKEAIVLSQHNEHKYLIDIPTNGKHQSFKSSLIKLDFIDITNGLEIKVIYKYQEKIPKWLLSEVVTIPVSVDPDEYDIKEKAPGPVAPLNGSPIGIGDAPQQSDDKSNDEYIERSVPELKDYVKSLFREMYFAKQEGGKQYKITNGRRIMSSAGKYLYAFDIDTEVNLAEDSPITLTVGHVETKGEIFISMGFKLLLLLKDDLGKTIDAAYLKGEPWKLLQSLAKRVAEINDLDSPMAMRLWKTGPSLSVDKPIDSIPKGQTTAIQKAEKGDITVIWGPPGTGKTHTMAKIALSYITKGKKVLIVSHSNISVDGIIKRMVDLLPDKQYLDTGNILRYGFVRDDELRKHEKAVSYSFTLFKEKTLAKQMESLEQKRKEAVNRHGPSSDQYYTLMGEWKKLHKVIRTMEKSYVKKAKAVATTISKVIVDPLFEDQKYDIVMFDEVSMALLGQVLCAASHCKDKLICVGDFFQLAPIVQSEAKEVLQRDIFSHLGITDKQGKLHFHPWLVMLNEQRRMHPQISAFSNKTIYQSLLLDHKSVQTGEAYLKVREPFSEKAITFIDTTGTYAVADSNENNSRYNLASAFIAFSVAITARKMGESVGIITPYAAQARLLTSMVQESGVEEIQEIKCATVHQFQGSESDVIIFDTVENYPFTKPGILLTDNTNQNVVRLINVAITRARFKFIMVGDYRFWERTVKEVGGKNNICWKLIEHMKNHGIFIQCTNRDLQVIQPYTNSKQIQLFFGKTEDSRKLLLDDLKRASLQIKSQD